LDFDRPLIHFTPPSGWMNDPNGLVYFEGEYHLFYQYIPWDLYHPTGSPHLAHWGHAVSTDLLHWSHLPVALAPDDLGAIYSGCVVVDDYDSSGFFNGGPGLVAIFTHNNRYQSPRGPQVQSIAYSSDRGRTWTTYDRNPVIANPGPRDFRDPKVFRHESSGRWVMVVTYNGDRVHFYTSENLRDWEYASEFGADQGAHGDQWECPDLFQLPVEGGGEGARWVLHLSTYHPAGPSERVGLQYFIGDFDGRSFHNGNPAGTVLTPDYGRDNYALVTWSNVPAGDGRRLAIGWMSDWAYARNVPTEVWKGAMTLPRELRLRRTAEGVLLVQAPAAEMERLRARHTSHADRTLSPDAAVWERDVSEAMEIIVQFDLGQASECGIRVHTGGRAQTTIGYDAGADAVFVDRTRSGKTDFSSAFPGRQCGPLAPKSGRITLRIYLDRSSVEVFANDGEAVISSAIFPEAVTTSLECYAEGGEARLLSLDMYSLRL